jgi:phage gp46-like protein
MCWAIDPTTGDYYLDSEGNFTRDDTPMTRAYLALRIEKGKLFWAKNFGTGLYAISRGGDLGKETERACITEVKQSLQFLVDEGAIESVDCEALRGPGNRLWLDIVLRGKGGEVYRLPRQTFGAYVDHHG